MQNFTHLNSRVPRHASRDREISDFLRNLLALFYAIAKKFLQLEQIKKSIKEFGNNDLIAIDEKVFINLLCGPYIVVFDAWLALMLESI